MTAGLNETHDPALRSWVSTAQVVGTDFPIQNLPFCVFRRQGSSEAWRGGVAIGDQVLDMHQAVACGAFSGEALTAASAIEDTLNALMALGSESWSALRLALSRVLREDAAERTWLQACLVPQACVEYAVPAHIGDYTDFYTSIYHATNVGKQFRPDQPLLPNYKWVPIGYHGRASSIVISGAEVPRPIGQTKAPGALAPTLGPSRKLDYELELGIFVGPGNARGVPIPIDRASSHVFGLCLINDWSARDIQAWEYQPLGPFLGKNFATTVSPWIVTLEALAPYRLPFSRPAGDPPPLPYLDGAENRAHGVLDIHLEVRLETRTMRQQGQDAVSLMQTSYRHAYWTVAQLLAHHTVNGCNLRPGDLFGSGTLSGPTPLEAGALMELTWGGQQPVTLPNGEARTYLEDGDSVTMRGWCERPGAARIGFGVCEGTVRPAL